MFQSWKDVTSRNSFLDIQDILASSTSSEEVEGGTKKKQAVPSTLSLFIHISSLMIIA